MQAPSELPFQQLINSLLDVDTPFNPRYLYRLSDLESDEVRQLRPVWRQLPVWRRQAIMEDVEEMGEGDYLLDFVVFCQMAVEDEDPRVRLMAVHTLWEYEQKELIPLFLKLSGDDPDVEVRSAAASGLGRFVYAGELEEIPPTRLAEIENRLFQVVAGDDDPAVRRAALESLGFSSRDEVPPLIQRAFASEDLGWKASALVAMGRSANLVWQPMVLEMLESKFPILRTEAARAAGELEIPESVGLLMEMLQDPVDEARAASIWSLSQIGGEEVRETLEGLYEEARDDDEMEYIESALENLAFTEGVKIMPLFNFPDSDELEQDEDDWYEDLEDIEDLFEDEEDDDD